MNETQFDVVAIGNAIVDVLSHASDDFLVKHGLRKGAMSLVDAEAADRLYDQMGPGVEASGGSAANTVAGIAGLGGRAAFIGKVADDQLGEVFAHDIEAVGVTFRSKPLVGGAPTARCLILVTPDAQRTMQTYLGACVELGPEDVDEDLVRSSKVLYLEGYLWDTERAIEAFRKSARIAKDAGRKVAFTCSDAFCVDRHRQEFLDFIDHDVDILFANESEIKSLFEVEEFDLALQKIRGRCEVAVLTRSEKGSVIATDGEIHIIDAEKGVKVVDTTGAGDAYAAGFLYAYTQGKDLRTCGVLGTKMAAEVISHMGPRAEADLKKLAASVLAS